MQNVNQVVTQQPQVLLVPKREKPNGIVPTLASSAVSGLVLTVPDLVTMKAILPAMKKQGEYSDELIETMHKGVDKALKHTGLDKKGVKIEYLKQFEKGYRLNIFEKGNPISQVKAGMNAFFVPKDIKDKLTKNVVLHKNTILAPGKDLSYAVFHELGHAHNFNMSKAGKLLQKFRIFSLLTPLLIGLYGMFTHRSKAYDGKELTSRQKTNNFIRDNAGKIAIVSLLPMLIEEGMATMKGQGWAKKFLSPENAKKVLKGNSVAYLSYLTLATAFALSARVAVAVKDKLYAKKEAKNEAIYQAQLKLIEDYNSQIALLNPEPHTSID